MVSGEFSDVIGILVKIGTNVELTPQEQECLNVWLEDSPRNRRAYDRIMNGEAAAEFESRSREFDPAEGISAIDTLLRRIRRRRIMRLTSAAAAAVVAGVIGFATFLTPGRDSGEDIAMATPGAPQAILTVGEQPPVVLQGDDDGTSWRDYVDSDAQPDAAAADIRTIRVEVPRGCEYRLRLDDGTVILLNSESVLEYPGRFAGDRREVTLNGEAYFEVAQDGARPFVVTTQDAGITVLGTSFNVSAYTSDRATTTTLVSGSVEVNAGGNSVSLSPGEQAVIPSGNPNISVSIVNPNLYISWTTGMFEFENMPLAQICERLSRWYDISFRFEDTSGDERFTGAVWKYKPLGESLAGIERVTDVKFRYGESEVVVSYSK